MRVFSIIILLVYFLGVLSIAVFSYLYFRKVKQARVDTGMEIPQLTSKLFATLPIISSIMGFVLLLLLIWESMALYYEL